VIKKLTKSGNGDKLRLGDKHLDAPWTGAWPLAAKIVEYDDYKMYKLRGRNNE